MKTLYHILLNQGNMDILWFFMVLLCSPALTRAGDGEGGGGSELSGVLGLTELSPHRVKGSYRSSSDGKGLNLDIRTREDGRHSLAISTLDGRTLLASRQRSPDSPLGVSLLGNRFILAREEGEGEAGQRKRRRREYLVPQDMHGLFEPALRKDGLLEVLGGVLDEHRANATRSAAIGELLSSREAGLLIDAARALADTGVRGQESPAAFLLFVLALRTQSLIDQMEETSLSDKLRSLELEKQQQQKDEEFCANSNSTCPLGTCPQGDGCTGMCGPGCECWEWVCGDCCFNKMCYDHDLCCSRKGFVSWSCLGIVARDSETGFHCSVPYQC